MFDSHRCGIDFLPNVRQARWHYSKWLSLYLKGLKISLDIASAILERSSVLVVIRKVNEYALFAVEISCFCTHK